MKLTECRMTFTEALDSYLEAREMMRVYPADTHRRRDAAEQLHVAAEHLNAMTNLTGVAAAVSELFDYTNTALADGCPNRTDVVDALNAL